MAPPRATQRAGIYALAVEPADPRVVASLRGAGYGIGPIARGEGLRHLEGLPRLRSLYLWQTDVTAEGVTRLRAARPELEVVLGAGSAPEP